MSHTEETERRVSACVNKFEGLTTEQIESMPVNVLQMTEFIDALNVSRDTYRELCVDLLNAAKDYLPYMPTSSVNEGGANKHVKMLHISDVLKSAITRAEAILGEKNETSS